jgi:hypothetical protein
MTFPRFHLFEFEDQPWFPGVVRDLATDYLCFIQSALGLHRRPHSLSHPRSGAQAECGTKESGQRNNQCRQALSQMSHPHKSEHDHADNHGEHNLEHTHEPEEAVCKSPAGAPIWAK